MTARPRRDVPSRPRNQRHAAGAGAATSATTGGRARALSAPAATLALLFGLFSVALWAAFASPLLEVRSVEVEGAAGIHEDEVRRAAAVRMGTPLARINTSDVAADVASLPRVQTARVSRQWPHTLRVSLQERSALARVAGSSSLVDRSGSVFPPAGEDIERLPELRVPAGPPPAAASARTSGVAVLTALPARERNVVRVVTVRPDGRVVLGLDGGRTVLWGTPDDGARKAAVLGTLLSGEAGRGMRRFDVSAPLAPSVATK